MERRHFLGGLTGAMAAAVTLGVADPLGWRRAQAQGKAGSQAPTRLLVGATTGGGTDIVARALAIELSQRLGKQVVVDNRPGAAGNIAAQACATAAPDGNTLLLCYTSHAINAALYEKPPFDPVRDFTPLAQVAAIPSFLVASPTLPVNDVKELIALARAQPGKLNIAIAGLGSANQIGGEMLKLDGGVDIVSVPYKGTGPAMADVMAGQIELTFAGIASGQALVKAGKLKALGVTSARRLAEFPDVPAISEAIPGYQWNAWYGLLGPAGMDPELAAQIAAAARDSLGSAGMKARFAAEGIQPVGSQPAEFAAFIADETARFGKVIRAAGLKPE